MNNRIRYAAFLRSGALLVGLLLPASALAQVEVAAGVHYGNSATLSAHAVVPVARAWDLDHSIRPQLTYAFTGVPAVSVSYVLTGAPDGSPAMFIWNSQPRPTPGV